MGVASKEAPPPQVEVVDVAPLIGGQLRRQRATGIVGYEKKSKEQMGAESRLRNTPPALPLKIITGSLSAYKQGFKRIVIKTSLHSAGLQRVAAGSTLTHRHAAALDGGAVDPHGVVSLLRPKVALQPLPLRRRGGRNNSTSFSHLRTFSQWKNKHVDRSRSEIISARGPKTRHFGG